MLGEKQAPIAHATVPPTIILLVGLQGSGKTTTAGKLAKRLKLEQKAPFLVAADVYRPAAIDQLQTLGKQVDVGVHADTTSKDVVRIVRQGIVEAGKARARTVIVDTAGRLQIDDEMMGELGQLKAAVSPHEILLVADGMTGQDAVRIAQGFHDALGVTGVILTKMDGDARGGAALSIYGVTKAPIKYIGVGEKLDALEPFHPDRLAGRILQQGDILSLVEKAQGAVDEKEAERLAKKVTSKKGMDLEDFLNAMRQMQKMGPLKNVLGMLPGMNPAMLQAAKIDDKKLKHVEAIVLSMTAKERSNPDLINGNAAAPDRQGQRAHGAGSEHAARAVQADAEGHEERGKDRGEGHEAPLWTWTFPRLTRTPGTDMATRIRLRRVGRKKLPLYRIVVADQEAPRDGRFIEIIGTYNPKGATIADKVTVDADKARQWISKGATPSETVQSLLKQAGVFKAADGLMAADARHMVVGRLRKPHGLKGDLTLFPITDAPDTVFAPGRAVWLVGLDGETVAGPVTIERSRSYHREWLIKFAGADRREAIDPWRGLFLAVPADELAPPEGDEVYLHELDGFAVRLPDETPLGLVSAVYELPSGLMIEVQGPKREFLLPYKKEFVREVDRAGRRLVVTPPEGLIE